MYMERVLCSWVKVCNDKLQINTVVDNASGMSTEGKIIFPYK